MAVREQADELIWEAESEGGKYCFSFEFAKGLDNLHYAFSSNPNKVSSLEARLESW